MSAATGAVLVAIPAHDEAAEIAGCLARVRTAIEHARAQPDPPTIVVAVAAHRCTDDTALIATRSLADIPALGLVVADTVSHSVGDVRRRLVDLARTHLRDVPPEKTWLLNTDADSRVPVDWIVETRRLATDADVHAVAGMVELHGWRPTLRMRERYASLIAAGIDGAGHTHVYGANLAVRLDAYDRVGGFRAVRGEDQDLVDRLRAAGEPVLAAFGPVVSTSARAPGRAAHGLGALLHLLGEEEQAVGVVGTLPK